MSGQPAYTDAEPVVQCLQPARCPAEPRAEVVRLVRWRRHAVSGRTR